MQRGVCSGAVLPFPSTVGGSAVLPHSPAGSQLTARGGGAGGGNISFCPRLAEPWGKGLGRETEARRVLPHSFLPSISQEEL